LKKCCDAVIWPEEDSMSSDELELIEIEIVDCLLYFKLSNGQQILLFLLFFVSSFFFSTPGYILRLLQDQREKS